MTTLTIDEIIAIGIEEHHSLIVHPTSAAYLQTLLTPYSKAIEHATIEEITQWIPLAFPAELAARILNRWVLIRITEQERLGTGNFDRIIVTMKKFIVKYLAEIILGIAGDIASDDEDGSILPWDIQKAISHEDFNNMFTEEDIDKLPVTVTIGPNTFTHMLTQEFVVGLLLFSDPTIGNQAYKISMFGIEFTSDYIVPKDPLPVDEIISRFIIIDNEHNAYTVTINNKSYTFQSPDFMQGFSTGALWARVDHHRYWRDLVMNSIDAKGNLKQISIQF